MIRFLSMIPGPWRWAVMAAAVLPVLWGAWSAYSAIWQRGYDRHAAETAEVTRALNEALVAMDREHRAATAAQLQAEANLHNLERSLEHEASTDPNAAAECLSTGGQLRIQQIP